MVVYLARKENLESKMIQLEDEEECKIKTQTTTQQRPKQQIDLVSPSPEAPATPSVPVIHDFNPFGPANNQPQIPIYIQHNNVTMQQNPCTSSSSFHALPLIQSAAPLPSKQSAHQIPFNEATHPSHPQDTPPTNPITNDPQQIIHNIKEEIERESTEDATGNESEFSGDQHIGSASDQEEDDEEDNDSDIEVVQVD